MNFATRPPTGAPSWPCVLVEGVEGSAVIPQVLDLATDEMFGAVYVVEVRDRDGWCDELAGPFHLVEHDGTPADIVRALLDVMSLPPVDGRPNLLIVSTASALWEMVRREVDRRASAGEDKHELWGSVTDDLWWRWMNTARAWPGVLVLAATAHVDDGGHYRVDIQRGTHHAVNCTVRCRPGQPPIIAAAALRPALAGLEVPALHGVAHALDMIGHPEEAIDLPAGWAKQMLRAHARLIHGLDGAAATAVAATAWADVVGPDARPGYLVASAELDAMVARIDEEVRDALTTEAAGEDGDGTASPDPSTPVATVEWLLASCRTIGLHVSSILDEATDGATIDVEGIAPEHWPAISAAVEERLAAVAAAGYHESTADSIPT